LRPTGRSKMNSKLGSVLGKELKQYGWLGVVAVFAAAVIVDTVRVVTERRKVG
jgi:hypothetical protein